MSRAQPVDDARTADNGGASVLSQPRQSVGRGVLEGAFQLLDVLARAPDGAGLSELSRESELPKATAYRLLGQLVELGAVHREGQRYLVGHMLSRLGRSWQPYPVLRKASTGPISMLADLINGAACVTVLRGDRVCMVSAAQSVALGGIPVMSSDDDLSTRTAAGQALLATRPDRGSPIAFAPQEWRRIRNGIEQRGGIAVDLQEVAPEVCCLATSITLPTGRDHAAISVLVIGHSLPTRLSDLVSRAAREVTRNLALH